VERRFYFILLKNSGKHCEKFCFLSPAFFKKQIFSRNVFQKTKGKEKMKNTTRTLSLILVVILAISLTACDGKKDTGNLWDDAIYTKNTEFGNGSKTITVICQVDEYSVIFTIHTDKETVGEALLEHNLISGEQGAYGIYIKTVNGIVADYNIDQSYWAFYENDDYAMLGVDLTKIDENVTYKLVYTK
jgi:hypothetical protein